MAQAHCGNCAGTDEEPGRRRFLKLAALGGGAMLLGATPLSAARASGQVEALLLSCMDYRLMDEIGRYMDGRGLTNNYDHVVLAGASLGATTDKKPGWGGTFFDHLDVAIQLHHVKKVIVIDHRDCGAYRVFLGKDLKGDEEKTAHAGALTALKAEIQKRHADLGVELHLMALDGSVETIAA